MTTTIERTGSPKGLGPDTPQNDLRTFLKAVEAHGELATVRGAHWDKELGAVTEVLYRQKVEKSPLLMRENRELSRRERAFRCLIRDQPRDFSMLSRKFRPFRQS